MKKTNRRDAQKKPRTPAVRDLATKEQAAAIGDRAADTPVTGVNRYLIDKAQTQGNAGSITATVMLSTVELYKAASLGKGPSARQEKARRLRSDAVFWKADAKEFWAEELKEGQEISSVRTMAGRIRDGYKPPREIPSLSMIKSALRGLKPKQDGRRRKRLK